MSWGRDVGSSHDVGRGWVVPLSATVMIGFGIILYGFSVYATDQAAGAEFSKSVLSIAYGGSIFVGGLLAIPVGRFADRHGVRIIVGTGTVLATVGLILFANSSATWHVVVAWWLFIGPSQAMIYYEPTYVAIDQWSQPSDRARTLATITFIGGMAGIVFIPLTAQLVSAFGWRPAVVMLAVLLLVVGGATSLFALPHFVSDQARTRADASTHEHRYILQPRFLLYTLALMLILLATQGVIAHRVARFEESGFTLTTVAFWAAAASAMSLPGRWIAPRLAERLGATRVQSAIALLVAASVALMVFDASSWRMISHFVLFGLAFGALLPLRAMVMGGWFSGPTYGRIMGTQWTSVVLVAASGPVLVGVMRDVTNGYGVSFSVLAVLFVAAAAAIALSGRRNANVEDPA